MASKARAFQQACRTRGQAIPFSRPEKFQISYSTYAPITPFASTCPQISSPEVSSCAAPSLSHRHTRHASTSTNSSNNPPRRAITVTSDDGRYNWSELSTSEKAARGTQQTFNFVIVAAGLVGTITISYLLYQELLAPDSSTVQFNAAVSRIKSSPECRALLGPSSQITAYGEPTSNKWARARPLAHSAETDRFGTTHFRMHFNVSGPDGIGVVTVHMTKPRDGDRLEYQLLSLTVKGHETVYLENKDAERSVKGRVGKMFGVQWR
ncbi:mitochondrial import inner membrane translocase subunit tim21 [Exophiala xenobiotica]